MEIELIMEITEIDVNGNVNNGNRGNNGNNGNNGNMVIMVIIHLVIHYKLINLQHLVKIKLLCKY